MALSKAQVEFLAMIVPIAQRQALEHDSKLYPSVTIAQAIHESGWGTSKKMVAANALFGVKVGKSAYKYGKAWKGAAYKTGTTEYYDGVNPTKITDWFRQYDTVEDSVCDYMDLLCVASRYKGALNQPTPQKSIEGIIAAGYATGPSYVKAIMKLINLYNLTQYDTNLIKEVNPYPETKKTLRRGKRGIEVKYLQWILNNKGYNCGMVDGAFGPSTEQAVKDFQDHYKLEVDGVVGKQTWALLKI